MPIEGKVAGIINERDLVINRGTEAGVSEGMKFKVMDPENVITDPDTGEELGSITKEKIRVNVVEVHPKYSVAKTYETYVVNVGGLGPDWGASSALRESLRRMSLPRQEVTRVRSLRADPTAMLGPIRESESFVKVGDPVIEIAEEANAR